MDTLAEAEMDAAANEYVPADKQSLAVEALVDGCTNAFVDFFYLTTGGQGCVLASVSTSCVYARIYAMRIYRHADIIHVYFYIVYLHTHSLSTIASPLSQCVYVASCLSSPSVNHNTFHESEKKKKKRDSGGWDGVADDNPTPAEMEARLQDPNTYDPNMDEVPVESMQFLKDSLVAADAAARRGGGWRGVTRGCAVSRGPSTPFTSTLPHTLKPPTSPSSSLSSVSCLTSPMSVRLMVYGKKPPRVRTQPQFETSAACLCSVESE